MKVEQSKDSDEKKESPSKLHNFKRDIKPKKKEPEIKVKVEEEPKPEVEEPEFKISPPSPVKEEDSVIFGTMESKKEQDQVAEAAFNSNMNNEVDKINESLLRISMMLNVSYFLLTLRNLKTEKNSSTQTLPQI